jgi:predicted permease
VESALDDEVQACIEVLANQKQQAGLSATEAQRQARLELGGIEAVKEEARAGRVGASLGTLGRDVRQAVRGLAHEPGFAVMATLTLTLAVGANTAILSVADAVLFRPFPYADPDRVFILQMLNRASGARWTLTPNAFIDAIDDVGPSVSAVGDTAPGPRVTVDTRDGPEVVRTLAVNAEYFPILGSPAARGRLLDQRDLGHEGTVAVLSYDSWRRRFASDEAIVGKTVSLGTATFDVVGVLPQSFVFPSLFTGKPEIVTLMAQRPRGTDGGTFHAIVRLAPGVAREQAQAEIEAAVMAVGTQDPAWKGQVPVLEDVRPVLYGGASVPVMRFLFVSATLILFVGCANLANLLLVRSHRRTREMAMRLALGAGTARLVWPIVFEGLLIALISAALAIGTTRVVFEAMLRQVPPMVYGNAEVGVDQRVAFATLTISLVSALLFAVLPAWRATRLDVLALLHGRQMRDGTRLMSPGRPLVIAQVALTLVALFGSAITARAFSSLVNTPLGFSAEHVIRVTVAPPRPAATAGTRVVSVTPDRIDVIPPPSASNDRARFYPLILDALRTTPNVQLVGASTGLPFSGRAPYSGAQRPGATEPTGVGIEYVLPGFFEVVGMPILRGRTLTAADVAGSGQSAIVSVGAARVLFSHTDPLGQTFLEGASNREFRVVGIVDDARHSLERADEPRAYVLPAAGRGILFPVARVRVRNDVTLADVKAAVRTVAPASFVTAEWWSDTIRDNAEFRNPRFQAVVLGSLGLLALTLTAIGVFGVVNYMVVSKKRELGLRLAIGASRQTLIGFVLRYAMAPIAIGLALGLLAVRWMIPLAEAQLFKVNTSDPAALALATAVVVTAGLVAACLPATRAASADPMTMLRAE